MLHCLIFNSILAVKIIVHMVSPDTLNDKKYCSLLHFRRPTPGLTWKAKVSHKIFSLLMHENVSLDVKNIGK